MNKWWLYSTVVGIVLSGVVVIVSALTPVATPEPVVEVEYDEAWCESMMIKPNADWQEQETIAFSENCL